MLRGLWKLVWVEIKVFLREPMGAIGTIGTPLVIFLVLGRLSQKKPELNAATSWLQNGTLPILAFLLIALGQVLSLTAIISIYREGGILRRLKATPLQPLTILAAHVIVKLLLSAVTLALLALAGKTLAAGQPTGHPLSLALAMVVSLLSILSIGFVIASVVPTARFAQPLGSLLLYPMLAFSGLVVPLDRFPPRLQKLAEFLPVKHAASLLQGIWSGGTWSEQLPAVGALALTFVICTAVASRIFRWE
jgi:ABC-2 type transport system permease protein